MTKLICILSFLGILGCHQSAKPSIPMEKMADIMLDIGIADQVILLHLPDSRDSVRKLLQSGLVGVHDYSIEEIDSNLYLYMIDLDRFDKLLKMVESKSDSLSTNVNLN